MYSSMISHTQIPNISVVHKQVKVDMEDRSKSLHKFTDLCQLFMLLTARATEGTKELFLVFDVVIPIVLGIWAGRAVVTYRTDNKEAGILITKIKHSVASWLFGYWTKICKYKHGMIKKPMENFDIDAAKLAGYSKVEVETLIVDTKFGDVDKQLDGIEVELGINQC
jgi:hypothetical protein